MQHETLTQSKHKTIKKTKINIPFNMILVGVERSHGYHYATVCLQMVIISMENFKPGSLKKTLKLI